MVPICFYSQVFDRLDCRRLEFHFFRRAQGGNVATIFALTLVPMLSGPGIRRRLHPCRADPQPVAECIDATSGGSVSRTLPAFFARAPYIGWCRQPTPTTTASWRRPSASRCASSVARRDATADGYRAPTATHPHQLRIAIYDFGESLNGQIASSMKRCASSGRYFKVSPSQ